MDEPSDALDVCLLPFMLVPSHQLSCDPGGPHALRYWSAPVGLARWFCAPSYQFVQAGGGRVKALLALPAAALVLVLFFGAAMGGIAEAGASDRVPVSALPGAASVYPGAAMGCTVPDPTGTGGCVTGAMAWVLTQIRAGFGALPSSCWDRHAWNPGSDHPHGKACDVTFGRIGQFPGQADVARGWSLARWLRANAAALHVSYVIWQGRIWSRSRDRDGWRPYGGGGVYDPTSPTGGHYDHVHVSVAD
jgi:hypothetical protein